MKQEPAPRGVGIQVLQGLEDVNDALFFWQDAHCFESYLSEKERKQLPQEYR